LKSSMGQMIVSLESGARTASIGLFTTLTRGQVKRLWQAGVS
jgi:hypothetical protein